MKKITTNIHGSPSSSPSNNDVYYVLNNYKYIYSIYKCCNDYYPLQNIKYECKPKMSRNRTILNTEICYFNHYLF